jgi:hypothetical protein
VVTLERQCGEFGEPGELEGYCSVLGSGVSGDIDGGFPAFELHPHVEFYILTKTLDDLNHELVLGRATGDKVLRDLLIEVFELNPPIGDEVIGEPCLPAFGLTADPVTHDEALVGVALLLDDLVIVEDAAKAAEGGGIGAGGFYAEIEQEIPGTCERYKPGR